MLHLVAVVGAGLLLAFAKPAIRFISLHFVPQPQPLRDYRRPRLHPAHAVIVGCVTGIGLGIAKELVNNGFGVFLLGNSSDELQAAKEALQSATPAAQVVCFVIDPTTATAMEVEDLVDVFKRLNANASVLVNNVGDSCVPWLPLEQPSSDSPAHGAIMDGRTLFAARLAAAMRPMLSTCRQRFAERSLILNITSQRIPGMPCSAMYGEAIMGVNLGYRIEFAKEPDGPRATDHIDYLVAHVPSNVLSPQANCSAGAASTVQAEYFGKLVAQSVDVAAKHKSRAHCPYWWHDLQWSIMCWIRDDVLRPDEVKIAGVKRYARCLYDDKT
ncbi:hypothetical protein NQ176_g5207 [Zarea fungicola]|uniref:Uncharacterized protein n=1 Tax=Zarea fungicola TaxID=93591 RepID=A0ACC1NBJ1_9HYPO|nr:hypothetical protein NQ176_g5207 [Lecanicillium fungicola]